MSFKLQQVLDCALGAGSQFVQALPELPRFAPKPGQSQVKVDNNSFRQAVTAAVVAVVLAETTRQLWCASNKRIKAKLGVVRSKDALIGRAWKLSCQGRLSKETIAAELGKPDEHSIYTYHSDNEIELYFRQWFYSCQAMGWEWSLDKDSWHRTGRLDHIKLWENDLLSESDKIFIQWLEIERMLKSVRHDYKPRHTTILYPPALDLPSILSSPMAMSDLPSTTSVPDFFLCPVSLCVMAQPVVTPSGISYDRVVIEECIGKHGQDPASGQPLTTDELYPNISLRDLIQSWVQNNQKNMDPAELRRVTLDEKTRSDLKESWQQAQMTPRSPEKLALPSEGPNTPYQDEAGILAGPSTPDNDEQPELASTPYQDEAEMLRRSGTPVQETVILEHSTPSNEQPVIFGCPIPPDAVTAVLRSVTV